MFKRTDRISILINYKGFQEKQVDTFRPVIFLTFLGHEPLWESTESYGLSLWKNALTYTHTHIIHT